MWEILANQLLPEALKTCPKSNKSPNLDKLFIAQDFLDDIIPYGKLETNQTVSFPL